MSHGGCSPEYYWLKNPENAEPSLNRNRNANSIPNPYTVPNHGYMLYYYAICTYSIKDGCE